MGINKIVFKQIFNAEVGAKLNYKGEDYIKVRNTVDCVYKPFIYFWQTVDGFRHSCILFDINAYKFVRLSYTIPSRVTGMFKDIAESDFFFNAYVKFDIKLEDITVSKNLHDYVDKFKKEDVSEIPRKKNNHIINVYRNNDRFVRVHGDKTEKNTEHCVLDVYYNKVTKRLFGYLYIYYYSDDVPYNGANYAEFKVKNIGKYLKFV